MRANDRALKEFLFARMYRHHRVNQMTMKAKRVVSELFDLHLEQLRLPRSGRPSGWRGRQRARGPIISPHDEV
jgi:dGTPase